YPDLHPFPTRRSSDLSRLFPIHIAIVFCQDHTPDGPDGCGFRKARGQIQSLARYPLRFSIRVLLYFNGPEGLIHQEGTMDELKRSGENTSELQSREDH